MIEEYKLENHAWFKRLYNLKEKWCTALSMDFFSARILSSQMSESTNSSISFETKKITNLIDFFRNFNRIMKNWRINERNEVYTLTLFNIFENEFLKSISSTWELVRREDNTMIYDVTPKGETN
ncbi:hypothetical protein ACS0TY_026962 [Phlomoides rotata]